MLDQCDEEAEKVSHECHTVECQSAEVKGAQRFEPCDARHFSGMKRGRRLADSGGAGGAAGRWFGG